MSSKRNTAVLTDEQQAEPANPELEAFKKKVLDVALWAKREQGWCEEGFNEGLEKLGLPKVKEQQVRVRFIQKGATVRYIHRDGPQGVEVTQEEVEKASDGKVGAFTVQDVRIRLQVEEEVERSANVTVLAATPEEAAASVTASAVANAWGCDEGEIVSFVVRPPGDRTVVRDGYTRTVQRHLATSPDSACSDPNCATCFTEPNQRDYQRVR